MKYRVFAVVILAFVLFDIAALVYVVMELLKCQN